MLKIAARWADHWDMAFPETPAAWRELDEVLRRHCEELGRDSSQITRSIHLAFPVDADPQQLGAKAEEFFAAGVDLIVWSMRGPYQPKLLEPLANALS